MSEREPQSLNDTSMADLFRQEVQSQTSILTDGLLSLERSAGGTEREHLAELMRAAHSLKGAARIVGCEAAVRISHAMEDCFVAAQKGALEVRRYVDVLLAGVDLLNCIGQVAGHSFVEWAAGHAKEVDEMVAGLRQSLREGRAVEAAPLLTVEPRLSGAGQAAGASLPAQKMLADTAVARDKNANVSQMETPSAQDRSLRVTADNLNQLLALAGDGLVASRWLTSFVSGMTRLKGLSNDLERVSQDLRELLAEQKLDDRTGRRWNELRKKVAEHHATMSESVLELDRFDRRFASLSMRLYQEVIDCRMRPMADAIQGFPRMVRDLAKSLGKQARFEIVGEATAIDRDILELVKAPIDHLLRNAIDHGVESPDQRRRASKQEEAVVRLEAAHSAGRLVITVSDDGGGIDLDQVRKKIVARNLTTAEVAKEMSRAEVLEFLFLPGFTLREVVSETSGRGVGLDVVQMMVKSVGGSVSVASELGKSTRFQMELPLTLSVIRALVVEVSGEPYAIPLSRIETTLKVPFEQIQSVEGRQHFSFADHQIGVVGACEVLELGSEAYMGDLCVVILGSKTSQYGLVVDRFIGERELVVRPLDTRLGKVRNIAAAALMSDGSPLLIVDVEDLIQDIERFLTGNRLAHVGEKGDAEAKAKRKHVLVVDDSLTVRELERKLLDSQGYSVDVAIDGMDGWNAVRTGRYDLVLTDIDMPRMDGIELVSLIRKDARLSALPVMIVSYKDRPEDRQKGLDAGADYYLTKGSFHDQTLIRAVADLIGESK